MNKLWIVTKNEFYRYFISPLAYVYLISFLLLNGSFAVYFGHFLERGHADLLPMFGYQPWLYLLFLPGISMRLWAEEFRTKTILQIITMPVSVTSLVWGKFFASWLFCALALMLTFPFWITVNILGTPDNGIIALSYFGSFILAGSMLAISQTMSALTKNQVIALVLSVIANLIFFLSGIEYILGFFRSFAPLPVIDMIASFSFITHFDTIIHGLLEIKALIFFTSLILLFNFTTILIISFKTAGTTQWLQSGQRGSYILAFVCLLGCFIGINLIANNTLRRFQIDFTEQKLYTLTDTTRKVLNNLSEPVTAKLYYSPILGERDPDVRLMFDKVRLLLERYAALSNGNFNYRIYNPEPFSDTEDKALAAGLQPLPIISNNTNAYFGLTLTDEVEKQNVIPYFPLQRQDYIEQDLTENLYLLNHKKRTLGIITSLPMFDQVIENVATQQWEIITLLQKFYNLRVITPENPNFHNLDALLIAHPQNMSPELEDAIALYTRSGGKILAFFDIAAEAPQIFAPVSEEYKPSDFGKLPELWGIKFHQEAVVADLGNSSTIDATTNYKINPMFTQDVIQFFIQGKGFNPDFKETRMLKKMMTTSTSVFTPLPDAAVYFIPLLEAGDNSELLPSDVIYNKIHPAEILRKFQKDANTKYIAARVISKNRQQPFEVIAVGDSDLLYDNFWTTHQTILEKNYPIPLLDNANFVMNALDTLLNNPILIELRGKSDKPRNFDNIEQMRKQAQQNFKIQEKNIFDDIEKTKRGLQEIWGKKTFEGRENFTADELAVIAGIRKTIEQKRRDLYTIRTSANQDISRIYNWVKLSNIYALPTLILAGMLLYLFSQKRKQKSVEKTKFAKNKRLFSLGGTAILCLICGIWAVNDTRRQAVADYENQPVFPKLQQQINDITQIELQTNQNKLVFKQDKGIWTLENWPHHPVYQQRIRSFLSALLEARFYEKKSNKAMNLSKYGLSPIEVKNSPTTRIELKNNQGKTVQAFEIGKYDIELGRGSKGAYLKFDNQFQVWLATMDLIDLSLSPHDWTFGTLWNLRFGRLASVEGNTDSDYIADVAKELLNQQLGNAVNQLPAKSEKLKLITLLAEDNNKVDLTFYKNGNDYYVQYTFPSEPGNEALQTFRRSAENVYYAISADSWEKINHAVTNSGTIKPDEKKRRRS